VPVVLTVTPPDASAAGQATAADLQARVAALESLLAAAEPAQPVAAPATAASAGADVPALGMAAVFAVVVLIGMALSRRRGA
jgi:hypothetical protein